MLTRRRFLKTLFAAASISMLRSVDVHAKENVKEIHVKLKRFTFTPEVIRVNEGDRVRLYLEGIDLQHGFYIDGYDIGEEVGHIEIKVLEFVADKPGTFKTRCSVVCGSLHPFMVGKLVVEPNHRFTVSTFLAFGAPFATLAYLYLKDGGRDD
ncbi:MAG: cupredoxin domain-containing protein [Candidatus Hydrothermarchaeales archaeon]